MSIFFAPGVGLDTAQTWTQGQRGEVPVAAIGQGPGTGAVLRNPNTTGLARYQISRVCQCPIATDYEAEVVRIRKIWSDGCPIR